MRKLVLWLLCLSLCCLPLCGVAAPEEEEAQGTWRWDCETLEDARVAAAENIAPYEIVSGDRDAFYDDFTTLQRTGEGESYLELSLPASGMLSVTTYHWPQELADFRFSVSADGSEWEEPAVTADYLEADGKWTRVTYELQIEPETVAVRIYWPDNPTWWTPLLSEVSMSYLPVASSLLLQCPAQMEIPLYDTNTYPVLVSVLDQFAVEIDDTAELSILSPAPNGVALIDGNILEVSAAAEDGTTFILQARYPASEPPDEAEPDTDEEQVPEADTEMDSGADTSADGENSTDNAEQNDEGNSSDAEEDVLLVTQEITLAKALLGDLNGDGVIDRTDLEQAAAYFGKTDTDAVWTEIRLADINTDAKIDILDLAYIAKQVKDTV